MKRIIYIICGITAVLLVSSCTNELIPSSNQDGDLVKVGLSLTGDVSVCEEPLTKAEESNALIGIQVYQNGSPYAWGLFDSTEGKYLYLHTGSSYSIVCQYIKNGKETLKLFEESRDATISTYTFLFSNNGNLQHDGKEYYWTVKPGNGPKLAYCNGKYYNFHKYSSGYGTPFNVIDNYNGLGGNYWWYTDYYEKSWKKYYPRGTRIKYPLTVCSITNRFVYDNTNTINVASSEVATIQSTNEDVDRYYGESGSFNASSESNRVISLDMKHLVYGIQCNVAGVSDGTASITIKNGNTTLFAKNDISGEYHSDPKMFAFSNMHGAWQYSDNYSENVTISMTWLRSVGVRQDLGSRVVQVKRNCMNIINVSLSATVSSTALSIEPESTDISNEYIEYSTHF